MMRPVRLASVAEDDIHAQLDEAAARLFWRFDLPAVMTVLSRPGIWESLPNHGGGGRLTVEGITVGAFRIFATNDDLDPRPEAVVIYAFDIWPEGFPDQADQ